MKTQRDISLSHTHNYSFFWSVWLRYKSRGKVYPLRSFLSFIHVSGTSESAVTNQQCVNSEDDLCMCLPFILLHRLTLCVSDSKTQWKSMAMIKGQRVLRLWQSDWQAGIGMWQQAWLGELQGCALGIGWEGHCPGPVPPSVDHRGVKGWKGASQKAKAF